MNIIFYDYETSGLGRFENGKYLPCQVIQVAAVAINFDTLSFTKNDIFSSYIKPIFNDEEAIKFGVEPVQQRALQVNNITKAQLEEAPDIKVVWPKFVDFCARYKDGSGEYGRAICSGFNITNFDNKLTNYICGPLYKLGPWSDDKQCNKIFHPRDILDLQKLLYPFIAHFPGQKSLSMDSVRQLFGFPITGQEHNATVDVIQGALLLIKLMSWWRKMSTPSKFAGSMADVNIEQYL